jgi:hypothetical protein
MRGMDFIRIAFARNAVEAGRIQSLIESKGFHPAPVATAAHVAFAGADQGYCVEVPSTEAVAVAALLRAEGLGKCLMT